MYMPSKPQVALSKVISGRIYDPKEGWIDKQIILTDKQKDDFVKLFGHGCTQRRKESLRDFIENATNRKNYGIYDRIIFCDDDSRGGTCTYCAGQDYPSELALIRKLVCGW